MKLNVNVSMSVWIEVEIDTKQLKGTDDEAVAELVNRYLDSGDYDTALHRTLEEDWDDGIIASLEVIQIQPVEGVE